MQAIKIISYIIISILLIGISMAVTSQVTSFTSQTNPFNITFTSLYSNKDYYLPYPSYAYITNLSIKLIGYNYTNPFWCFQSGANYSSSCGGNKTGRYDTTGTSTDLYNAVDNNYSTRMDCTEGGIELYANYTGLSNSHNIIWSVNLGTNIIANISLSDTNTSCYNSTLNKWMFKWACDHFTGTRLYCRSSTLTDTPIYSDLGNISIYEEEIYWNITNSYPINVTIKANNITIANFTKLSTGYISLNNSLSNQILQLSSNINISFYSEVPTIIEVNLTNATYSYGIDNCSNSFGIPSNATALNISSYDENTLALLNINLTGTLNYSGSIYTINSININNVSICIYPNWGNTTLYAYFQESAGEKERYYIENAKINNITQQIYLYNFLDTSGVTEERTTIYDNEYKYYPNVLGLLQRYYPATNTWTTVQVDKSDETGGLIYYIYESIKDYKIIWMQDGVMLGTTAPIKFFCTSTPCETSFTVIPSSSVAYDYSGFSYTTSYNNETKIFVLTYADSAGLVKTVNLLVEQVTGAGRNVICNVNSTGASGTLTCDTSAYTGTIVVSAFRSASPDNGFFNQIITIASSLATAIANAGRTNDAIFLTFLLSIGIIGIGLVSPILTVLFAIVSSIFIYFIGAASLFTIGFIVSACLVGLIIMFMVKR